MKDLNLEKIILFGHNFPKNTKVDETTWAWYEKYPDMIIPFACQFDYKESDSKYAKQCLEKGFFGFGELLIGHKGARECGFENITFDDAIVLEIFRIAGKFCAPVMVHCDCSCVNGLLNAIEICGDTTFIWSHIGYDFSKGLDYIMPSTDLVRGYLEKFNNLYFDISFWIKSASCMNNKEYKLLLEEYSKRFIFGLDLTGDYQNSQKKYSPDYFKVLSSLSENAQKNILYGNINELIEKRTEKIQSNII